jgi:UDP-N-acetylglucosamine/UDP-N-acetylgalactosamine diphosphorylase
MVPSIEGAESMNLIERFEIVRKMLGQFHQEHLLQFWPDLDDAGRERLLDDIERIDFEQVARLIQSHVLREPALSLPGDIQPPAILPAEPADTAQKRHYAAARARGEELIRSGKVACLTVAGGQGTRLGFDGPKGALPISPVRNKPLFQLFAEQIRNVGNRCGVRLPWLIMTSPANDWATKAFFEANAFFGLCRDEGSQVVFFTQGVMPAIGLDGRVLLEGKDRVALSPDGHGGTLRAIYRSGALGRLQQAGVQVLSYFQVDNPLIHPADPLFIGLHDLARSQVSSKTIPKAGPTERVGNFCTAAGRLMVIEYSDLPDELAHAADPAGRRVFDAASIAIHLFDVEFIAQLNRGGEDGEGSAGRFALPFHRAVKKVARVDDAGQPVAPDTPNAVKLETFIFDALPLAERTLLLATRREEEFAPAKNASGADSVATARAAMVARSARWLESAGVAVPRKPDGTPDAVIEISPLLADSAEQLAGVILPRDVRVRPGGELYLAGREQA